MLKELQEFLTKHLVVYKYL